VNQDAKPHDPHHPRKAAFRGRLRFSLVALLAVIVAYSGSLAVAAELIHNAVDLVAAGAVLIGLRIATRKSDAFPYGLYMAENLVAAPIGAMSSLLTKSCAASFSG
jgi:divalent metal cation (Fe/Co/Zn/Cd) transporter